MFKQLAAAADLGWTITFRKTTGGLYYVGAGNKNTTADHFGCTSSNIEGAAADVARRIASIYDETKKGKRGITV